MRTGYFRSFYDTSDNTCHLASERATQDARGLHVGLLDVVEVGGAGLPDVHLCAGRSGVDAPAGTLNCVSGDESKRQGQD